MNKVVEPNRFDIFIIRTYTRLYKYIDYKLDTEKYEIGTTIKKPKINWQNLKQFIDYNVRLTHNLRQYVLLGERSINYAALSTQKKEKNKGYLKGFPRTPSITDSINKLAKKEDPTQN